MDLEVAGGMKGDRPGALVIAPDAQRDPLAGAVDVRPLVLAGRVCDLRQPCSHRSPVPGVHKTLCAADRGLDAGFVGHGGWLYHAARPGPSIRRMAAIT